MNNKEVAHLWANQSRERAKGSSFYFEGDTIYSYGSHFPIARHCQGVVLFTDRSYSNSTARHKSITRMACNHLDVFTVANPTSRPGKHDITNYRKRIESLALKAARARNPAFALSDLQRAVDEANRFSDHFKLRARFEMPGNLEELKAKAAASAARERKAAAAKKARQEKEAQETIGKWLAGESVTIPHYIEKVYLRTRLFQAIGTEYMEMVTSKGASIPLTEAEKAFRFAMIHRARGWHKNGERFAIGDYQLDAVNEHGVVAGCHRVGWDEIERFAKLQGWL